MFSLTDILILDPFRSSQEPNDREKSVIDRIVNLDKKGKMYEQGQYIGVSGTEHPEVIWTQGGDG